MSSMAGLRFDWGRKAPAPTRRIKEHCCHPDFSREAPDKRWRLGKFRVMLIV
jgi:hypothetical protein